MQYLCVKGDLPGNSPRVKRGVITCLLCVSIRVTPLFVRLIFVWKFFECWNNRGPPPKMKSLLRTVNLIKRFVLFQYSGDNISAKRGICRGNSPRVRRELITCLLCVSVKFTPLFVRIIYVWKLFECWNNRGPPLEIKSALRTVKLF